jgi:hypothetical protein
MVAKAYNSRVIAQWLSDSLLKHCTNTCREGGTLGHWLVSQNRHVFPREERLELSAYALQLDLSAIALLP